MKAHWLSIFLILFCLFLNAPNSWSEELLTRKKALLITEALSEVQAFYALYEGKLINCIEKSIDEPCDSDWVTCVDDAWVVSYVVGEACNIVHDGRLSIRFLIDRRDGRIISRFPEKPYFINSTYCIEDYDCVYLKNDSEKPECKNFIFGQLPPSSTDLNVDRCKCLKNQCYLSDSIQDNER